MQPQLLLRPCPRRHSFPEPADLHQREASSPATLHQAQQSNPLQASPRNPTSRDDKHTILTPGATGDH